MTVASGVVPYEYHDSHIVNDSKFHFRVNPTSLHVPPSAVFFEEAMYVAKAEHYRKGAGGQVFDNDTITANDGFSKHVSAHLASGIFDPDPSGRYLGGQLPIQMTTSNGTTYVNATPASWNFKNYIADLRQVVREVFDRVAQGGGGSLTHFDVAEDWLQIYKGYTDGWAQTGLFYLEDEDEAFRLHSSGAMESGVFLDRYLNEVRYQPMPYLSGSSKDFAHETKAAMNLRPIKPVYWKTNGGLGPLWSSGEAFGDVLISNAVFMFSGGGESGNQDNRHTTDLWFPSTSEEVPTSGNFTTVAGMAEGVYIGIVGASGIALGTGLFPWGTGFNGFSRPARIPNTDANLPESGGQVFAVYISDNTWITQPNTNLANIGESGLNWRRPLGTFATQIDFYVSTPADSGSRLKWGNEFYGQNISSLPDAYRPGQFIYDRSNDEIIRVGNSGFTTLHANYPLGTGVITTWSPSLALQSTQFLSNIGNHSVKGLETITFDGSDYICNGHIQETNGLNSVSGVLLKLDTSFNPTDYILENYKQGRIFWHRGNSEYLYLSNSGSLRRILEEVPNRFFTSGTYFTTELTWGDFTSPVGQMDLTRYFATIGPQPSSLWNMVGAGYTAIRIVNFFNEEGTDDLYGMALAFPSGVPSGSSNNLSRYIIRFDDTGGHPYTVDKAWLMGTDDSLSDMDSSIRNVNFSFFADDFQY